MPRVRHFYATTLSMIGGGERDHLGSCDHDAWRFGFGRDYYMKLEVKGEHVESIWFDLRSGG